MKQHRWLTIIGIGEDGLDGLSSATRDVLAQAELVVGGARHLALAGPLACETWAWPSPLAAMIPEIVKRRGQRVCVLASGDPFFYGIGTLLSQHVAMDEIVCLPGVSAFSLVAARLGWSLQDCSLISLHGRDLAHVLPLLQPGRRIIALTWDETTPRKLAAALTERGMGETRITLLEALGGPQERIRTHRAVEPFDADTIMPLNTVALEVVAGPQATIIPLGSGLADTLFEHDGQMTKREIRAVTLSSLRPLPGQLLWNVGAGSGSIGIEWMLAHPSNRAVAIEEKPRRIERIMHNAAALGVPTLAIVQGKAPSALQELEPPDAVFVGGGMTTPGVMDTVRAALRPGGRLVVNTVTLESQESLLAHHRQHGGELITLHIARAEPVGSYHGWRAAMPLMQWAWVKP